jgi:hypothetical protein
LDKLPSFDAGEAPRRLTVSLGAQLPTPVTQCILEFRRRLDGLTYRYHPCESANHFASWKREDLDLWLVRDDALGWVGVNAEGEVFCIPWAVPVSKQGSAPPPGVWVSCKAEKSYVYDLVFSK